MQSPFLVWSLPALVTALLLVGGPTAARLHVVQPIIGFLIFALSLLAAVITLVVGITLLVKGHKPLGGISLLVALIPLGVVGFALVQNRGTPRINDITSNLEQPPALTAAARAPDNQGKDLTYPEAFKEQVRTGYADLRPLSLQLQPDAAFALAARVASSRPYWTLTVNDPGTRRLEGEETAGLFQFTDDFAIVVTPEGSGSRIDMRSRSRVGQGDFGANAKRIRAYFAAVTAAAAEAATP